MIEEALPLADLIVLEALPSMPVGEYRNLPTVSGIYFVLNEHREVQYVGRARNIRVRWYAHHRLEQYLPHPEYSIAWLVVTNTALLPDIEAACIAYFAPVDNREYSPKEERRFKEKVITLRLDDELHAFLVMLARREHRSLQKELLALIEDGLLEKGEMPLTSDVNEKSPRG